MENAAAKAGKKKIALMVFGAFWIVAGVAVLLFMNYKRTHISTDDAYIEGRVHIVASKIPGTVKAIHVADNQMVKKGDILLELDDADYEARTEESRAGLAVERARRPEALARLEAAKRQLSEMNYRASAAKATLEAARAALNQAGLDIKRAEGLLKEDAIAKEKYEKTKTAYEVALSQLSAANELHLQTTAALSTQASLIKQSGAAVETAGATIAFKEASLKSAELNLGYTKITAPANGLVTKKSVQGGNQIQPGQPLMAVVPLDDLWVTANYKETQLRKIRPGQEVSIRVDAYPDRKFRGRVESIMAGTGSVFSLFPPENATGNYVKIVQRVPVKISIAADSDPEHTLRVGMSVIPTVLLK